MEKPPSVSETGSLHLKREALASQQRSRKSVLKKHRKLGRWTGRLLWKDFRDATSELCALPINTKRRLRARKKKTNQRQKHP